MINRLLYVATATALISVFMFDENFAANLSRAIGEPIDMWEVGAAGTPRHPDPMSDKEETVPRAETGDRSN